MAFEEIDPRHHKFWQSVEYWKVFVQKTFSKAFDFIHCRKMEQILLAYGLPKEIVAAIMMLYKNTKVKVHSSDGDRFLWHCCRCAARVRISPYLFIICFDYVLRTSIDLMQENGFRLVKVRSRIYAALRTQTTPMTLRYWQIHPPRPNPCCIVWNGQQVA